LLGDRTGSIAGGIGRRRGSILLNNHNFPATASRWLKLQTAVAMPEPNPDSANGGNVIALLKVILNLKESKNGIYP
jgi:hypothetical protein